MQGWSMHINNLTYSTRGSPSSLRVDVTKSGPQPHHGLFERLEEARASCGSRCSRQTSSIHGGA